MPPILKDYIDKGVVDEIRNPSRIFEFKEGGVVYQTVATYFDEKGRRVYAICFGTQDGIKTCSQILSTFKFLE